MFISEITEE